VRAAAGQIADRLPRLDLLINNAGVMATPLMRTAQGFAPWAMDPDQAARPLDVVAAADGRVTVVRWQSARPVAVPSRVRTDGR
jgi:NAD(P)-dependent dehydrogenase (short-subunit alcohol dehydrogenase family)